MRRVVIIACAAVALLSGCCQKVTESSTTDSTYTHVITIYRDSVIRVPVPAEAVSNETLDTVSVIRTGIAESVAIVRDGRLIHRLVNRDDQTIPAVVRMPYTVAVTERLQRITQTLVREVATPLKWWQKMLIAVGGAVTAGGLGIAVYKIIRKVGY